MTSDPGSARRLRHAVVFACWVVALALFAGTVAVYRTSGHALVSIALPAGIASVTGALYLINDRKGDPR